MKIFRGGLGLTGLGVAAVAAMAAVIPSSAETIRMNGTPPTRIDRQRKVTPTYGGGRCRSTPPKGMNGERECARRRRQIAAGSLTESNGLVR